MIRDHTTIDKYVYLVCDYFPMKMVLVLLKRTNYGQLYLYKGKNYTLPW